MCFQTQTCSMTNWILQANFDGSVAVQAGVIHPGAKGTQRTGAQRNVKPQADSAQTPPHRDRMGTNLLHRRAHQVGANV